VLGVPALELVELDREMEPEGISADDPCWRVPWLIDLLEVPADAVWPRFMSAPHPDAVGSYGAEAVEWCERRRGRRARWFQRLVWARLLEHDADGALLWETLLLTLARQVGKTFWVHDLCAWRLEHGHLFGVAQTVTSTGRNLKDVQQMQAPARAYGRARPDEYDVCDDNNKDYIEFLADGGLWQLRAVRALYGTTNDLVTVDEAWDLSPRMVDDGIEPTTVTRPSSQIVLTSTAHSKAKPLMIGRRMAALEALRAPAEADLLIEWSAPRDAELGDREAWRMASPYWDARRERRMAKALRRALGGASDDPDEPDPLVSFRSQWLNQWPLRPARRASSEPLLGRGMWANCDEPDVEAGDALVVAVEDNYGNGAAVAAVARLDDGRFEVDGWLCDSWDTALGDALALVGERPRSRLIVGASLATKVAALRPAPSRAGAVETRTGLPLLRQLVAEGQIVHDDCPELDAQLEGSRVRETAGGLVLCSGTRSDLVHAAVWALRAAQRPAPVPAIH
jgi:hypothetical protein